MSNWLRELICGGAASVLFIILTLAVQLSWPIGAGLAALVYVGMRLVLPGEVAMMPGGISRAEWQETLDAGSQLAQKVKALNKTSSPMRAQIGHIGDTLKRIEERLREDPACHATVGNLLKYEAKGLIPVLEQYLELVHNPSKSAEVANLLQQREKIIPLIGKKLDEHYQKLLRKDLLDFEVASETLGTLLGIDEFDLHELEQQNNRSNNG